MCRYLAWLQHLADGSIWCTTYVLCCCRRLPGCPSLASGLLQAAVQTPGDTGDLAHQQPTYQSTSAHGLDQGQPLIQPGRKHGTAVTTEQEKLVLDCLLRQSLLDYSNSSLRDCDCKPWGDVLGTEWVTTCCQPEHFVADVQQKPHRLYVQASPGEMRLATVMTSET